MRSQAFDT